MQTLGDIRAALDARGLRPRRSLGQNFLIDQNLVRKLVDLAAITPGDLVLEVGPGTGALTDALVDRGAEVVACELDPGLAELLRERFGARITLVEADCLQGKRALAPALLGALAGRPFQLVANLPYGCATPLMLALLVRYAGCGSMHVTIQHEVAQRLAAAPPSKAYGAISVLAQALAEVELVATLPPACFWPRPEVTSAMVCVRRRSAALADAAALESFCARVFASRRKQLGSVLGRAVPWPENITPAQRAESLPVADILALGRATGDLPW